uniref:Ribosomal protein-like n=1 Tax=Oryza sativa subsp. japonica TaxID=39947 RepID=Q67V33_ORYSJ|nr:ribosomal protein-like [Oryza sativa Japonica Group]
MRFRMRLHVFLRIMKAVEEHDDYFKQKRNAAGVLGLSCLQKVVAAFRMLAYGVPADALDEYIRIGESTALEALRKFVAAVVEVFGPEYMRKPNEQDAARLLTIGASRGFPGSHNDINVLQRSDIFARLAEGEGPQVNFDINGHEYSMGYYLADGIYPSWATFVKTIPEPQGNKKKYFAKAREACRKDVERAFGVLQSCFAIVRGAARMWDEDTLHDIMMACIIMHNMIVEDERDDYEYNFNNKGQYVCNYDDMGERVSVSHDDAPCSVRSVVAPSGKTIS